MKSISKVNIKIYLLLSSCSAIPATACQNIYNFESYSVSSSKIDAACKKLFVDPFGMILPSNSALIQDFQCILYMKTSWQVRNTTKFLYHLKGKNIASGPWLVLEVYYYLWYRFKRYNNYCFFRTIIYQQKYTYGRRSDGWLWKQTISFFELPISFIWFAICISETI